MCINSPWRSQGITTVFCCQPRPVASRYRAFSCLEIVIPARIAPTPSSPHTRCITDGQAAALEQALLDLESRLPTEPWWANHCADLHMWLITREIPIGVNVTPLF